MQWSYILARLVFITFLFRTGASGHQIKWPLLVPNNQALTTLLFNLLTAIDNVSGFLAL